MAHRDIQTPTRASQLGRTWKIGAAVMLAYLILCVVFQ